MARRRQTIHDLLARTQARYRRLTPAKAFAATKAGALLIDLRTDPQRRRDGGGLDAPLVLLCAQGYSSGLAVGTLLDLGASRVTDVIGGFEAWRAAGLPVQ